MNHGSALTRRGSKFVLAIAIANEAVRGAEAQESSNGALFGDALERTKQILKGGDIL
jgi:hypothetical protein